MTTTTTHPAIALLRHHAGLIRNVVAMNLEGLTHEQSLLSPDPAGNSANWVLGHLVCIYNRVLPLLGQEPALEMERIERYDRGSPPITPAEARPLAELRAAWDETVERVDAGLAALDPDSLDRPAAFSPSNNPDETTGTLVTTVLFHQSYHAGQLGILRRVAGLEGAIR
jgi:uncharacterized damage-inducible protein DinB